MAPAKSQVQRREYARRCGKNLWAIRAFDTHYVADSRLKGHFPPSMEHD
jgi:hypothetical protein